MTRRIDLRYPKPDEWVKKLKGKYLDDAHFKILLADENVDAIKPDGSPLFRLRSKVLSDAVCRLAFQSLRTAAMKGNTNRTTAGGGKKFVKRRDGTWDPRAYPLNGKANYYGFAPKGRGNDSVGAMTSWTKKHPEEFAKVIPFARELDRIYQTCDPDRYQAQRAITDRTSPYYVISDTVFTTVYCTWNWRTAVHPDSSDLKGGLAVMSGLKRGSYEGGYLVFPKYEIAVSLEPRDVLLADVHEFHGNTPIAGDGEYDRIMTVSYFTTKMADVCPRHSGPGSV